MVQVRVHQPVNTDGSINLDAWLDHVCSVDAALDREALKIACEFAQEIEKQGNQAKHSWADGTSSFQAGLETRRTVGPGVFGLVALLLDFLGELAGNLQGFAVQRRVDAAHVVQPCIEIDTAVGVDRLVHSHLYHLCLPFPAAHARCA